MTTEDKLELLRSDLQTRQNLKTTSCGIVWL